MSSNLTSGTNSYLDVKFIGEAEKDLLVRIQERLNYLFDEEEQERDDLLELSGELQKKVFGGNKVEDNLKANILPCLKKRYDYFDYNNSLRVKSK